MPGPTRLTIVVFPADRPTARAEYLEFTFDVPPIPGTDHADVPASQALTAASHPNHDDNAHVHHPHVKSSLGTRVHQWDRAAWNAHKMIVTPSYHFFFKPLTGENVPPNPSFRYLASGDVFVLKLDHTKSAYVSIRPGDVDAEAWKFFEECSEKKKEALEKTKEALDETEEALDDILEGLDMKLLALNMLRSFFK